MPTGWLGGVEVGEIVSIREMITGGTYDSRFRTRVRQGRLWRRWECTLGNSQRALSLREVVYCSGSIGRTARAA